MSEEIETGKPAEEPVLSVRGWNALRNELRKDDFTPEEVAKFTEAELMRTPNFGRKSLKEVKEWLAYHGLYLEGSPPVTQVTSEVTTPPWIAPTEFDEQAKKIAKLEARVRELSRALTQAQDDRMASERKCQVFSVQNARWKQHVHLLGKMLSDAVQTKYTAIDENHPEIP